VKIGDITLTAGQRFRPERTGLTQSSVSYKRHRFPPQIIAHVVWLYFRFPLSFRLVEEMLLERGIMVSYETVRRWG
jgi:putative transposase